MLEPGPLEIERPALADQAHIGQRLLDAQVAGGPLDDEHEVQVAVADLASPASRPARRRAGPERGQPGEIARHGPVVERAVALRRPEATMPISARAARPARRAHARSYGRIRGGGKSL